MFGIKLNKTMKDIHWSFISLATSSVVHLLLRLVLGRELGPYGLGLYTLVFTVYMFGSQFAGFGIEAALIKYIAQNKEQQEITNNYMSSGLIISTISGLIIGGILYLSSNIIAIAFFDNLEMAYLLKTTAICFPFISMQKTVLGTLNGLHKMKNYAIINIAQNVSMFLLSIILVFLKMGTTGAVLGFVVPTISVGVLSLYLMKNNISIPHNICNSISKELVWFGFYVILGNSIGIINTQIDSISIGYFMTESDVGYYSVAVIFMQGIVLFPQAVQRVTTPTIARYHAKQNYSAIRELIKSVLYKISLITLLISILLILFGKFLIVILFSEAFSPAYAPLTVLLLGYMIYSIFASIGGTLSSIGKVNMIFKIGAFSAVINILLNICLIPKYGLLGAAGATSTSLMITVLLNLYFINRYTS